MKETRKLSFTPENLLSLINKAYGKNWSRESFSMSSRGAVIVINVENS